MITYPLLCHNNHIKINKRSKMTPSAIIVTDTIETYCAYQLFGGKVGKLCIDKFRNEKLIIIEKGINEGKLEGSINAISSLSGYNDVNDPFQVSIFFDVDMAKMDRLMVYCNSFEYNGYFVDLTVQCDTFYKNLRDTLSQFVQREHLVPDAAKFLLVDPVNAEKFVLLADLDKVKARIQPLAVNYNDLQLFRN
jgi:hypothetical protein